MSEAKAGCASLEDVEESTFIRFSQFAYTGDYTAADPEILLDSSTIASTLSRPPPVDTDEFLAADFCEQLPQYPVPTIAPSDGEAEQTRETEASYDTWAARSSTSRKAKSRKVQPITEESAPSSRKEELWKLFESITYTVTKPSIKPRKNREYCEDYTEVFLCHARLYVFAEKYDIFPLRKLCLNKLHETLCVFTLYKERVGDIVTLMRYIYANTVQRLPSDDPLRSLVIHYAACVVEKLVSRSEFRALLEEPGELASDLVVKMINRLD